MLKAFGSGFHLDFNRLHWILLDSIGFWSSLAFEIFHWISLGSVGFHWVLLDFIWLFWIMLAIMERMLFVVFSFAVKFIYSEKATKFCEISTLLLSVCTVDKSKVEISQNFVAFSEYTNFKFMENLLNIMSSFGWY